MTLLKREEWHDITRLTDWDFSYVDHEDRVSHVDGRRRATTEREAHGTIWREDYRNSYGEYVATQREKDTRGVLGEGGVCSVRRSSTT